MKRLTPVLFSLALLTTSALTLALTPNTASAQDAVLEEVIVTARKIEEALQDIPMSVSSFDGEVLEQQGVVSIDRLIGRTPSLYFSQNNSRQSTADNTALIMRGVGSNPVLEPSVGVFLDGVYVPSLGFDLALVDIERIEVLRGPQGSLFGRNTPGGAISIITRQPADDFGARVVFEVDDLSSTRGMGSISGPLAGDSVFAGLSINGATTDGHTRNTFLGVEGDQRDIWTARLNLRYTPSDATEVLISADVIGESGREQGTAIDLRNGETFDFMNDFDGDMKEDNYGMSLTITHDFRNVSLTSITGFRDIDSSRASDFEGLAEGSNQTGNEQRTFADQKSFSQELRLSSIGNEAFDWIIGAFVYDEKEQYETDIQWRTYFALSPMSPPGSAITSSSQDRSGFAVFGQANFSVFDGLVDLTLGLRYSDDDVDAERFNFITIPEFGFTVTNPNPTDPAATGKSSGSFDNVSGTFQAAVNMAEGFKPYVNVAQGYKGGGFDRYPTSSSLYLPFNSEETINYEVGAKGIAAGGRLSYSLALYKIDIDELQQPTLIINPDTGLLATAVFNAGEASTEGIEVELSYVVNDVLALDLAFATTDGEFDKFTDSDGIDRAGDPMPNIPNWTAGAAIDLEKPISDRMKITGSLGVRYIGKYNSGLDTSTDFRFSYKSYTLIDVSAGLIFDDRLSLSLFARNAGDEFAAVNMSQVFISGLSGETLDIARVIEPRVVGLRMAYSWE